MAQLLFMEGYEQYGDREEFLSNGLWTGGYCYGFVNRSLGGKCGRNDGAYTANYHKHVFAQAPSVILGFAVHFLPGLQYSEDIAIFGNSGGVGLTVRASQSGRLILRSHPTASVDFAWTQSPKLLCANTWYYFEIYVLFHGSAGKVQVRVDGLEWLNVSNVDTTSSAGAANGTYFNLPAMIHGNTYVDDVYLLGTVDPLTDFKGPVRVHTLYPAADTVQKDFEPLAGATNYGEIDDVMVSPSVMDGNETAVVAYVLGSKDLYAFSTLPQDLGDILGIQVIARGRKDDDYARNLQLVLKSSLSEALGADVPMSRTYLYQKHVFELDPATGLPWESEAVNTVQAGFQITV